MKREQLDELRASITEKMIEALEKGTAPWQKPWCDAFAPHNGLTGRRYTGGNALFLGLISEAMGGDPRWVTFNQAQKMDWHVKKGAKGTKVFFWKFPEDEKDEETGEVEVAKGIPFAMGFTLFHATQIEGIPEYTPALNKIASVEAADQIIKDSGAIIRHGGNVAGYYRGKDIITMPYRETFQDVETYYSTLLHELTHWTGHESRLARPDGRGIMGSEIYAREELVAEMAAVYLTAETGIAQTPEHFEQHAAYVGHWIQLLKKDPNALFKAASDAQKAANYLTRHVAKEEEGAA